MRHTYYSHQVYFIRQLLETNSNKVCAHKVYKENVKDACIEIRI
jgi:hypothetical protein